MNNSSISVVEQNIIKALQMLGDPASQYDYLLQLGMAKHSEPEIQKDAYRVSGCKTAIWIHSYKKNHKVYFQSGSDSILVKGVLALMDILYQGRTSEEIQAHPMLFLDSISDEVIYEDIKNNGLSKCYRQISCAEIKNK
jgi:sulfur transfer protein SufE